MANHCPAGNDAGNCSHLAGQHQGTSRTSSFKMTVPWQGGPLLEDQARKVMLILAACKNNDILALVSLATSEYGFVEDDVRQVAWPIVLGCLLDSENDKHTDAWRNLPKHRDEEQVKLDVNRSFIYYPENQSDEQLDRRKGELSDLITEVLRRHPLLCYFQGYHDIVQVLLLVLGVDHAGQAVAHLSLLRIRDFMLPSLTPALSHLELLPSILYAADPQLCKHLSQTQPFFALAATLTLYAHDIQEYGDISRLFDFLLAREAVISVYLFAVIVLQRKDELFEIDADEPEMLHSILSKLPKPLDLEALISKTMSVFEQYPPESLPFRAWSRISSSSVLKTTRDPERTAKQTPKDGEDLFQKQAVQLRMDEVRKRVFSTVWLYRRPAGALGLAFIVGVLSWWMRRNGSIGFVLGGENSFGVTLRKLSGIFGR